MKQINLKDDPGSYGLNYEGVDLVVTKYESGYYDGSGEAIVLRGDNVEIYNLGHCSCNGPFEYGPETTISIEEFKSQNQTVTTCWSDDTAETFLKELKELSNEE